MSTFVYMTRCDGCGHCVDICPSDIMHIDENIRRAKNIEPNFCWECYSCVKACPNHAIDVRGYADFAPMGHSVRVRREEEKGTISWKIKFRNGTVKDFVSPITTKPWGKFIPKLSEEEKVSALVAGSAALQKHCNSILESCWDGDDLSIDPNENPVLKGAMVKAIQASVPQPHIQRMLDLAKQGWKSVEFEAMDTDWQGQAYGTVSGQNSNNSVRVPESFMELSLIHI